MTVFGSVVFESQYCKTKQDGDPPACNLRSSYIYGDDMRPRCRWTCVAKYKESQSIWSLLTVPVLIDTAVLFWSSSFEPERNAACCELFYQTLDMAAIVPTRIDRPYLVVKITSTAGDV